MINLIATLSTQQRQAELREEEKRQKEEEKKRKEQEEENRKKKAADALKKFFVPKKKEKTVQIDDDVSREGSEASDIVVSSNFMPFQIREHMKLAPLVRVQLTRDQREHFDKLFSDVDTSKSYLKELKDGKRKPLKGSKTWQKDEDELMVVGELNSTFASNIY